MSKRSALHMTAADVVAHATKNKIPLPKELSGAACNGSLQGGSEPKNKVLATSLKPKRKGDRRLKKHRQPNDTEKRYGLVLEAMKRRGEIVCYGFEEITLRWADLEYTPDFFVIRNLSESSTALGGATFIDALYIEVKGGFKWADSIVKFKTARARFTWARFEMWDYVDGRWTRLA